LICRPYRSREGLLTQANSRRRQAARLVWRATCGKKCRFSVHFVVSISANLELQLVGGYFTRETFVKQENIFGLFLVLRILL